MEALREIGETAKALRRRGKLKILLDEFPKEPDFADDLLISARDLKNPERLRRAAAWVLSQINDWPSEFNRKVFDDKELQKHTLIDASLAFMPQIGEAEELDVDELKMALRFLPHLDGKGIELRWDTRNYHLGPFFRVMCDPYDKARRCIQYVYIWSRQVWPISAFFTFYFWPFLSLLALIPWIFENDPIPRVALIVLSFALGVWGAYRTLFPPQMRSLKNDTWYLGGAVLLILGLYNLPWSSLLPLVGAAVLFIVRSRYGLGETQHVMDYGPVFLYLRKTGANWSDCCIERVRIDRHHYTILERSGSKLRRSILGDTLFIKTDNIWRSFDFADRHGPHVVSPYRSAVLGYMVIYAVTLVAIATVSVAKFTMNASGLPWMQGILFAAWSLLAPLGLIALNEIATTQISDPHKDSPVYKGFVTEPEKRILGKHKLIHLWNMTDDKANFVIRKKMQNPFRTYHDEAFWSTFRDPSAERLAYEAHNEVRQLGKAASKGRFRPDGTL